MSSETATPGMPDAERRSTAVRNVTYALAAFLSLLGAIRYGLHAEAVVVVFVIAVLVVISRHDLERHIIPNRIVVPAWVATLLAQIVIGPHHWLEWIVASFGAGAFFLVIQLAYPAGLGMGDVKPWRIRSARRAHSVIELAAGEAERRGVSAGDRLLFDGAVA